MSRYTSLPENSKKAMEIMKNNFPYLETNFTSFMQDLTNYVESEFSIDIKKPQSLLS